MRLDDVRIAFRALGSTRLRTALTLLGVLIGTAAVILLVGVVAGTHNLVQHRMDALGTRSLYVIRSDNPAEQVGTSARGNRLRPRDVAILGNPSHAPHVAAIAPAARTRVTITWEGVTYIPANFTASPPSLVGIYNIGLSSGHFYTEGDEADRAKVTVLGQTTADHLFGHSVDPVGQKVSINNVSFTVIGVMEAKGTIANYDQDDTAFVPLATAVDNLTGPVDSFEVICLRAATPEDLIPLKAEVDTVLRREHGLRPGDSPGYAILSAADLVASTDSVSGRFNSLLFFVALISLIIGGIGLMNIMLVSVTERTREIGIRKALGAQRTNIRSQFLTEALVVSLAGGLLGIAAGLAATSQHLGEVKPEANVTAVVAALVVSAVVGILSGAYPAERAARLTPIEALRYE